MPIGLVRKLASPFHMLRNTPASVCIAGTIPGLQPSIIQIIPLNNPIIALTGIDITVNIACHIGAVTVKNHLTALTILPNISPNAPKTSMIPRTMSTSPPSSFHPKNCRTCQATHCIAPPNAPKSPCISLMNPCTLGLFMNACHRSLWHLTFLSSYPTIQVSCLFGQLLI